MKRQNKCTSDTSLVQLPIRKKLFEEIQKYLADYDIYLKYYNTKNNIQLHNGLITMQNILMSDEKVYIYEHSQIIIGYYFSMDKFIDNFRGDAFFENARENMILSIEKNTKLYQYCMQNYDNLFQCEPKSTNPDIKLFVKLFHIMDDETFFILDL